MSSYGHSTCPDKLAEEWSSTLYIFPHQVTFSWTGTQVRCHSFMLYQLVIANYDSFIISKSRFPSPIFFWMCTQLKNLEYIVNTFVKYSSGSLLIYKLPTMLYQFIRKLVTMVCCYLCPLFEWAEDNPFQHKV